LRVGIDEVGEDMYSHRHKQISCTCTSKVSSIVYILCICRSTSHARKNIACRLHLLPEC